jgi:thiamine pyrophosphate-dependent acetolactate synthase large subunit-like protein
MAQKNTYRVARRSFIKGAAGGAAVLAVGVRPVEAQNPATQPGRAAEPTAEVRQAESGTSSSVEVLTNERPGSDFMVDVLKALGFEYVCANPGSSFRGLHESLINYGGNRNPELITCCHEESAVAMGHGYAKVEGKPLAVLLHGAVGAQHAAMAVYNAYCDRVPVYLISANLADATSRRPGVEWEHSVQDGNTLLRDFVKWDDTPASLAHFAESAVRAYKIAMTPPAMPVALVADGDLQENAHDATWPRIPKLTLAAPPQGDSGAVAEAARFLVAAQSPVIIADRAARTSAGMKVLVELAETLQAPVIDQGGRMNFPSRHPLNHSDRSRVLISDADVILGLELTDFWGTVNSFRDQLHRTSQPIAKASTKLLSIASTDLFLKSNYQDFERYPELDLAIAADAEATLPSLIEAVKRLLTDDRKRAIQDRGAKLAVASRDARERARTEATYAWDASPISTARLSAELWAQIKAEDWSLVSEISFVSRWPMRLWNFDKPYQFLGGSGGAGVGYGAPSSVGSALANRKHGRLSVSIQNDGDLMYAPGVLWTAAHHRIPLLSVMHNNRAYHQEVMHVQRMATRHNRGITQAGIGTTLDNPNIDYAKIAQGMGLHAEGPISDPKDLGPALKRAVEIVKRGEPALIDVVTQPR